MLLRSHIGTDIMTQISTEKETLTEISALERLLKSRKRKLSCRVDRSSEARPEQNQVYEDKIAELAFLETRLLGFKNRLEQGGFVNLAMSEQVAELARAIRAAIYE